MKTYLELLRVHQWLKNLLLLFPPFLGGTLLQLQPDTHLWLPLLSFCCSASALYIFNDLFDLRQDQQHPLKCQRPLAAGKLSKTGAIALAVSLLSLAIVFALQISIVLLLILLVYITISFSYSAFLKNIPLVELFCVVSGFLLRLEAGGIAYQVKVSNWLFLSVFLLALFLVCGKRLGEIKSVKGNAAEIVRPVLAWYPKGFLEGAMYMSGAAALVAYTLYVIDHHGNIFLIPICCFGLLSYLMRVFSGKGGDPTRALLKDPALLIVGILWVVLVGVDILC